MLPGMHRITLGFQDSQGLVSLQHQRPANQNRDAHLIAGRPLQRKHAQWFSAGCRGQQRGPSLIPREFSPSSRPNHRPWLPAICRGSESGFGPEFEFEFGQRRTNERDPQRFGMNSRWLPPPHALSPYRWSLHLQRQNIGRPTIPMCFQWGDAYQRPQPA